MKTFDVKNREGHWRFWIESAKIVSIKRLEDYKDYLDVNKGRKKRKTKVRKES